MTNHLLSYPAYFPKRVKHIPTKRIFDLVFSLALLAILWPLLLCIAVCVICSTKTYPIYRQQRVGRGGRPFFCYKFRSMCKDADQKLASLLENDPLLRQEWDSSRKLKNDPRITPFGHFLRKTSLDELPQFFNVLKGDLSVVGPRAVVFAEIESYFQERAQKILTVRPGVTGLWQVNGRSDTSYLKRIHFDETYIERRSFLLDLWIVLKTIPLIFNCKGAY